MRALVLLVASAFGLALLVGLDWWVDPLGDHYRGGVVAEAFDRTPPCAVSTAVLGDRSWPAFKLDLFERRDTERIVVGTSRVWKIGAHPGERHFTNVDLPGMSVDSILPLFRRLAVLAPGRRLVVYLGTEPFWFSEPDRSSTFKPVSLIERLRLLASSETLRATVRAVRSRPETLVMPLSRSEPAVVQTGGRCVFDEERSVAGGSANAWAADGTFLYNYELTSRAAPREDFVAGFRKRLIAPGLAPARLADLEAALAYARSAGWQVVGFAPPFAHGTLARLERDDATTRLMRAYRTGIPALYERYGFTYVDLADGSTVPCGEHEFTQDDGGHANGACAARVRAVLDRAARDG